MVGYLSCFLLLIKVGTPSKGEFLIELEFGMLVLRRRETGVLSGEPLGVKKRTGLRTVSLFFQIW